MAKFIYRMQNILGLKYKLEEQAKIVFGQAQQVVNEEEAKLKVIEERQLEYEMQLTMQMKSTLNIPEIKRCEEAIEIIKYQRQVQQVVVNAAKQKLELARIALNEAMAERKTHEKLREKAFEEFKKEVEMEERKEVDELVSFTYAKNQKNEV